MPERDPHHDVVDVARHLSAELQRRGHEYALGGAIALGYWSTPRGTLDVNLTLFLSPDKPGAVVKLLQDIGCEVDTAEASAFIEEHGFCRATFDRFRVDVFLPITPFYDVARDRRKCVDLEGQPVMIWDAETLAVFKMMFFREKDFVDIKQMLRSQGTTFDRAWVRQQLVSFCGERDPQLARWDELASADSWRRSGGRIGCQSRLSLRESRGGCPLARPELCISTHIVTPTLLSRSERRLCAEDDLPVVIQRPKVFRPSAIRRSHIPSISVLVWVHSVLALLPTPLMAKRQVITISASITAYSTAVAASSRTRNLQSRDMVLRVC